MGLQRRNITIRCKVQEKSVEASHSMDSPIISVSRDRQQTSLATRPSKCGLRQILLPPMLLAQIRACCLTISMAPMSIRLDWTTGEKLFLRSMIRLDRILSPTKHGAQASGTTSLELMLPQHTL